MLGVFKPGQHGSTFGGNPLACAIGRRGHRVLETGEYQERSRDLGDHLLTGLARGGTASRRRGSRARPVGRHRDRSPRRAPARAPCERCSGAESSCKDTHDTTIRLAPPLVIERADLDWALDQVIEVLSAPAL